MKRVEWAEEDSNLRCFFVADLQSAVFAAGPPAQDRRAVNSPNNGPRFNIFGSGAPTYIVLLYLWIAVNPDRTAVYLLIVTIPRDKIGKVKFFLELNISFVRSHVNFQFSNNFLSERRNAMSELLELANNIVDKIPWIVAAIIITTIYKNKPKHVTFVTKFFKLKSDR